MPHYLIEPKSPMASESEKIGLPSRIVEAKNAAQALAHVVEDTLTVRLAKPLDIFEHGKAGREIETAK